MTEELNLDQQPVNPECGFEIARALQRCLRAMHDGQSPQCSLIDLPERFRRPTVLNTVDRYYGYECAACGFCIWETETEQIAKHFHPYLQRSAQILLEWRESGYPEPDQMACQNAGRSAGEAQSTKDDS